METFRPETGIMSTNYIVSSIYGHLIRGDSLISDCGRNTRKSTSVLSMFFHSLYPDLAITRDRPKVSLNLAKNNRGNSLTQHLSIIVNKRTGIHFLPFSLRKMAALTPLLFSTLRQPDLLSPLTCDKHPGLLDFPKETGRPHENGHKSPRQL